MGQWERTLYTGGVSAYGSCGVKGNKIWDSTRLAMGCLMEKPKVGTGRDEGKQM